MYPCAKYGGNLCGIGGVLSQAEFRVMDEGGTHPGIFFRILFVCIPARALYDNDFSLDDGLTDSDVLLTPITTETHTLQGGKNNHSSDQWAELFFQRRRAALRERYYISIYMQIDCRAFCVLHMLYT